MKPLTGSFTAKLSTTQRSSTTTATPTPDTASKFSTPAPQTIEYIEYFSLRAGDSGQYVVTTISKAQTSRTCSITLTNSTGAIVTKKGTIISTGSTLACDFGGVIAIEGHGSAKLSVSGADGTIDTKETNY